MITSTGARKRKPFFKLSPVQNIKPCKILKKYFNEDRKKGKYFWVHGKLFWALDP
jgi:hypothetical protein